MPSPDHFFDHLWIFVQDSFGLVLNYFWAIIWRQLGVVWASLRLHQSFIKESSGAHPWRIRGSLWLIWGSVGVIQGSSVYHPRSSCGIFWLGSHWDNLFASVRCVTLGATMVVSTCIYIGLQGHPENNNENTMHLRCVPSR